MKPGPSWSCGALAAAILVGCASDPMIPVRDAYSVGDYTTAEQLVTELVADGGGDRHVYELEKGVIDLAVGTPDAAIKSWRPARDRLDELQGRGLGESIGALLTDDNALDYEGTVYERVMTRVMLMLAEVAANGRELGDDVLAYAGQIVNEHRKIRDELMAERPELDGNRLVSPDARIQLVAFGSYLVGTVREDDPLTRDEAANQYRTVLEIEPDRSWIQESLRRAESGRLTAEAGNGVLHVFGLVGRAPSRVQREETATQDILNLATFMISILNHSFPQIQLTGIPIPVPQPHGDNPESLRVFVDGNDVGSTRTVTDIEEIARLEFEATKGYRIARGLVRRAVKIGLVEGARAAIRQSSGQRGRPQSDGEAVADLALSIGGMIWTASESADLRCWSLLPAQCQAARIELPPGDHLIELRAEVGGRPTGAPQTIQVRIGAGRSTYVIGIAPTVAGGPPPLSRQSIEPAQNPGTTDRP